MKRTKTLLALMLAFVVGFITFSCSSSNRPSATTSETTTASANVSALEVNVFEASEKGALVTSTLIEGEKEAILVDSQLLLSEAKRLTDKISQSGKTLKAIWITHGHPDHYFGLEEVLAKFPNTPVYSTAAVVEDVRQKAPNFVKNLKQRYGDDVTDSPVIPEVYDQDYLELEGQRIEIVPLPQGDTKNTTSLNIPSIKTVIAGDVVYWGVHPFLAEVNSAETRSKWIESIDKIKAMNPERVIPGHKAPTLNLSNSAESLDSLSKYLETFGQIVEKEKTADAAYAAVEKAYPDYQLAGFFLKVSTQAAYSSGK